MEHPIRRRGFREGVGKLSESVWKVLESLDVRDALGRLPVASPQLFLEGILGHKTVLGECEETCWDSPDLCRNRSVPSTGGSHHPTAPSSDKNSCV